MLERKEKWRNYEEPKAEETPWRTKGWRNSAEE